MTDADLAALAAAGLMRYAEGTLVDLPALAEVATGAAEAVSKHVPYGAWPRTVADAVSRLKRELRRR